uniref:Uncharacterized protein n=1 Tax=Setaria digitata TaxID=48799 RepID=A0A915PJQ8_9BILA
MAINPCCCWNIKDGTVSVGLWSLIYSLASLVLFGWQLNVISSCQTVTMSQANLQCEYWCPCVGTSNERTTSLIQGWVYCIVQLALFSWQSYAIKYYRDITANQLIPGHNIYAAYSVPSYIENYYASSLTVFYTGTVVFEEGAFLIDKEEFYQNLQQTFCQLNMPAAIYQSCGRVRKLKTFDKSIFVQIYGLVQLAVFGWQVAAIKYEKDRAGDTILPNYNEYGRLDIPTYYETYWQSPEERFYTGLFVIQILCLIASFFLLFASCSLIYGAHTSYCVFVVLLFYRYTSDQIIHYNDKQRKIRYRPKMYNEFRKENCLDDHLPELECPLKSGYRRNESKRYDQHNNLYSYTPAQQSAPVTPIQIQRTTFADDLVNTWVKEQQTRKDLPDCANSEPAIPQKPEDLYPLKHSYSVPSIHAETSSGRSCRCHRHKHCHHRHHHYHHHHKHRCSSRRHGNGCHSRRKSPSRHRSPSAACSSESGSTLYSNDSHLGEHRSLCLKKSSVRTGDLKIFKEDSSRQIRSESDSHDFQKFRNCRHSTRKLKHDQPDVKKATAKNTSGGASPAVAVQTDSVSAYWPLDPQKGLAFPQQIIIPPSPGSIGQDGRLQPQTYQINSEIRISYDPKGKPVLHEVSTVPGKPSGTERSPSAHSRSQVNLIFNILENNCA